MQILRIQAVSGKTGLPKASIYREVAKGTFPAPIKLSQKCVGWRDADLDDWIEKRAQITEQERTTEKQQPTAPRKQKPITLTDLAGQQC